MILPEIHSTGITEDGADLSIWLVQADGSLLACYLPLAELIARAHLIEQAPADDEACAGKAAELALARIRADSKP